MSPSATARPRNRILAALPSEIFDALAPHLELVELGMRDVVQHQDQPITSVHFPETGWFSLLAYMENGDAAEVGLIGREGMLGVPLLLGMKTASLEAMVQGAGTAWRMDAVEFGRHVERAQVLRDLLLRYVMVHHEQVARTAACNGRHQTTERLARWLLMAHDRADGDTFAMTHEFMSMMLGIRRAGVTVAAAVLQKAGVIRYERGSMTITDRAGLEQASCECYGLVRRMQDQLLCEPVEP